MKKMRILFPLYLIASALLFSPRFYDAFIFPKMAVAVLFASWLMARGGIRRYLSSPYLIPVSAIIFFSALSIVVNGKYCFLIGDWLGLTSYLVILTVSSTYDDRAIRSMVVYAMIISSAAVCVYSVVQYLGGIPNAGRFSGTAVPYATLGNPNYVADYTVLAFPFIISAIEKKGWIYIPLAAMSLIVLLMTGSWRGLLGLSAATFVYAAYSSRLKKLSYSVFAFFVLVAGGLFSYRHRTAIMERHLNPRIVMWKISFEMFKSRPATGYGLGTFSYYYPEFQAAYYSSRSNLSDARYAKSPQRANNEYIHILAETGIVGLLLFMWLFWTWAKRVDIRDMSFGLPVAAGVVAVLTVSFFGYAFHRPSVSSALFLLMGLSAAGSSPAGLTRCRLNYNGYGVIIAFTGLAVLLYLAAGQLFWENARRNFEAGRLEKAEFYSNLAVVFNPVPGRVHFLKGRILYREGRFMEALREYGRAEETYRHRGLYFNRGLVYLRLGNLDEAEADFLRSYFITPGFRPVKRILERLADFKADGGKKLKRLTGLAEN